MKRQIVFAVPFLLFACATMGGKKEDLQSALDFFHHDLRWGYLQAAAAKVDPRYADEFLRQLEKSEKDLKITDYEVRRVEISPDGKSARVQVRLVYYLMPSTVVRDETLEQVWEKGEVGWRLKSQAAGPYVFPPREEAREPQEESVSEEP